MDPLIGGALIGAATSAFGAHRQNREAKKQSAKQMKFQERMSSTAHQREVKDLRKAGLNPTLSAMGGQGAASPSGAAAPVENVLKEMGSSALATANLDKDLGLADSQQRLQTMQMQTEAAKEIKEISTAKMLEAQTKTMELNYAGVGAESKFRAKKAGLNLDTSKFDHYWERGASAVKDVMSTINPIGNILGGAKKHLKFNTLRHMKSKAGKPIGSPKPKTFKQPKKR